MLLLFKFIDNGRSPLPSFGLIHTCRSLFLIRVIGEHVDICLGENGSFLSRSPSSTFGIRRASLMFSFFFVKELYSRIAGQRPLAHQWLFISFLVFVGALWCLLHLVLWFWRCWQKLLTQWLSCSSLILRWLSRYHRILRLCDGWAGVVKFFIFASSWTIFILASSRKDTGALEYSIICGFGSGWLCWFIMTKHVGSDHR